MLKAHRIIAGLLTVLLAGSLVACSSGGSIATVNGHPISKAAFDGKLEASQAANPTLQQMVVQELLNQYAASHKITASDAEITTQENQLKLNFPNGSWSQMLAARHLTEADVHTLLGQQIILDKAVGGNVVVSDAQIKAYFDKNHAQFNKPAQVRARHILVPTLALANTIEAKLKAGGDFAKLAEQYSQDPGTKAKGGELGWFRHGQMVPSFDHAAFTLPIGAISAPVKSPFGYHIIQVEQRTPAVTATLANSKTQIANLLRQQQEQPLIQPFIANLQANAKITTSPQFAGLFPSPPPSAAPVATTSPASSVAPATSAPVTKAAPAATKTP